MSQVIKFLVPVVVGLCLFFMPMPVGVDPKGWHLFAIFVPTILGIILKPLPMGPVALLGLVTAILTGTLELKDGLSGFSSPEIWLIVFVFFIARGIIKTQLGTRVAYLFVRMLGKRTLGLGYGMILTELFIAPGIPSSAARAGGIMYPILRSISQALGSDPEHGTERKLGSYLTQVCFHGNLITSAMFLTAMAANPIVVSIAAKNGVTITWANWALAASVPGLTSIILIPLILYFVYPPEVKILPEAVTIAKQKLHEMGPISGSEWIMLGVFSMMLFLWIFGKQWGISTCTTALLGLCLLLVTKVLTWKDILEEHEAWHILVWASILVMMSAYLEKFGFIAWFSGSMESMVLGWSWMAAFMVLALVYFYSHYFFASNTAHVSAMYAAFLAVSISAGAPPLLAAMVLGFLSSLFSSTTHYGSTPAVILFGTGYVTMTAWWSLGFLISIVNLLIWFGVGGIWWKALGIW
ncbi:MAG: anion permease [Alphaproteobacteria bacterium]|nr:anion permease [Alphaproteobacteria bacterium]